MLCKVDWYGRVNNIMYINYKKESILKRDFKYNYVFCIYLGNNFKRVI